MSRTETPLSVCLITKNEADRIGDTIRAVLDLAHEVVVVDSGSTDDTLKIAGELGAKIFHRDWTGFGPQKRFSEDCASHDWILNLDADEVVSPELADEIRALLQSEPDIKAWRVKIRNVYPGQMKPRLWADYTHYVRLYDRRRVRFRDSMVHDTVDTKAEKIGDLKGPVIHFSARSYDHIRAKLKSYVTLQSKELKKPKWLIALRLPFEYPFVFVRFFLLRRHFTGGWDGVLSRQMRR